MTEEQTPEVKQFLCETCGTTLTGTDEEAFQAGWDYPPRMGEYGVISPRTCGKCGIETTAWWAIAMEGQSQLSKLDPRHQATVKRILEEMTPTE